METVLESHLALLEQEAEARPTPTAVEQGAMLDVLVALHTAFYGVLESRIGPDGVTEAHRPLVPLFQRWLRTGRRIVQSARESKAAGRRVAGVDDLVKAINLSKAVAEHFDHYVELNKHIAAGDFSIFDTYRLLSEVTDELRTQNQSGDGSADRRSA